ncbi:MAG: tetratricopeptide repeat protein [Mariprofundaceae bacterium]
MRKQAALTILLVGMLSLSACGKQIVQNDVSKPATSPSKNRTTDFNQMQPVFLFLAAQSALQQQHLPLAVSLLTALHKKDPSAAVPLLQLIPLQLRLRNSQVALHHINAGLSAAASWNDADQRALRLLQVRALVLEKQTALAITLAKKFVADYPKDIDTRRLLIKLQIDANDFSEAHRTLIAGLSGEHRAEFLMMQARLYARQENIDAVRIVIKLMRKESPDDVNPVILLSRLENEQQHADIAEAVLRDFIKIHPESMTASHHLGKLFLQQKRFDESIEIYEQLVEKSNGNSEVLSALGLIYYQTGKFEKAIATFERSVKSRGSIGINFYLAASLEAAGRKKEAAEIYDKFSPQDPAWADAQLRLAKIEFEAEHFSKVRKRLITLTTTVDSAEVIGNALLFLSIVHLGKESHQLLLDDTQSALKLENPPAELLFNRAVAYEALDDYQGIEDSLQNLLTRYPEHDSALNFLGYVYAERGVKLDEAEAMIRKALNKKGDDGFYLDSLAWVLYQRGQFKEALKIQLRALDFVTDDPVMYDHLGDIYWRVDDVKAARQAWRKSIILKYEKPELLNKKIEQGL